MLKDALRLLARHGRACLVVGLVAGFALPGLAAAMKPFLPAMVAALVFVTALRIGARAALGSVAQARETLGLVLAFQIAAPVLLITGLNLVGMNGTAVGLALVLVLAAPSISGGPTFTAMLGHDPAPSMRLLVLGTALLPLTILPVLWLVPTLGGFSEVAAASLRLTAVIFITTTLAFTRRRAAFPNPGPETIEALDGVAALSLSVIVVGLMSAVGPTLQDNPSELLGWLALAFAVNFGMQAISLTLHRLRGLPAVAPSIVAGNRNIALFLVALPAATTDQVLIFIGCYQVPMYLTPIVMRRFYGPAHPA